MKFLAIILLLIATCGYSQYQNPTMKSTKQKVDALLSQMTVEEKIGQLNLYNGTWEFTGPVPKDSDNQEKAENIKKGLVGGMLNVLTADGTREAQKLAVENSRLGIPLIFGYDVIHGYKTMAPIPLAQAASWDAEVARKSAELAALEASSAGIHWTFAPMVDVTRDARWGRMMESPGEDPYLASVMARAWVRGFEGSDLSDAHTIASCVKHFAAYGFAEAGLDYNTVDISHQTLYNVALPPFKAAAEEGAATFMNAFNEIAGVPATGSELLQRQVLKGDWGWKGFVVSDWASIGEMTIHGYAEDMKDAAVKALNAGSDMDMESYAYLNHLKGAIQEELVSEDLLDDAVRRILKVKFDLGLFDDPYKYCDPEKERSNTLTEENLLIARDAGRKSIVLLKNEKALLPLAKSGRKVAVIGPLAKSKDIPLGSWRAQAEENSAVSLLEGITEVVGEENVTYADGYVLTLGERSFTQELTMAPEDESGFQQAIGVTKKADVVVLAIGEDCWQSGEGRSQTDIRLKGSQQALFNEILKVNSKVVVVLMTGRALAIPEIAESAPAILNVWHLGSEAGNAIADVLFGDYNPTGKLPVSFPHNVGQLPLYYNHKNTGRPEGYDFDDKLVFWSHYTDSPKRALFPFGYGLSYSEFEYGELSLSKTEMTTSEKIVASIKVRNLSDTDGIETVQLYLRDHAGSFTRPVKELKAFQKVSLNAGEEKLVSFEISNEMLSFYRSDLTFGSEPGKFTAMVGGNSVELKSKEFVLK